MKHIKTYEELNTYSPFILYNSSSWSITGDNIYMINVYQKLIEQLKYKKDKKLFETTTLIHSLTNNYKDAIGVYLYFEEQTINRGISYYVIRSSFKIQDQINDAKDIITDSKLTYRGELKLINDVVVVDTLEVDIEKYNL